MKRLLKTTIKTIAPALAVAALLSSTAYAGSTKSLRQHDTASAAKRECRTFLFWSNCEFKHSFSSGYSFSGHGSHSKSSGPGHESHSGDHSGIGPVRHPEKGQWYQVMALAPRHGDRGGNGWGGMATGRGNGGGMGTGRQRRRRQPKTSAARRRGGQSTGRQQPATTLTTGQRQRATRRAGSR